VKALLVVDMLIGFCRPGHSLSLEESTLELEARIAHRIHDAMERGDPVFFACDAHQLSDPELQQFAPHCLKDTPEAQIVETFAPWTAKAIIVEKHTFSPFYETDLEVLLASSGVTAVAVAGVCTDICVLFTVEELRNRGYTVSVEADCVMASRADRQEPMLRYFERVLGIRVSRGAAR
jgi:nicotinamidase/pyrazinamidase